MRFVAVYCGSGPYRHIRRVVEDAGADWFPWGYRLPRRDFDALRLGKGDEVELWEVDDTRGPSSARPLVVAAVDFASHTGDYLAMTLRPTDATVEAGAANVVRQAASGQMLALLNQAGQTDVGRGTVGARHEIDRASDGSPVPPTITALSVGK